METNWIKIADANLVGDTEYWVFTNYDSVVQMYWSGKLWHYGPGNSYEKSEVVTHVTDFLTPPKPAN